MTVAVLDRQLHVDIACGKVEEASVERREASHDSRTFLLAETGSHTQLQRDRGRSLGGLRLLETFTLGFGFVELVAGWIVIDAWPQGRFVTWWDGCGGVVVLRSWRIYVISNAMFAQRCVPASREFWSAHNCLLFMYSNDGDVDSRSHFQIVLIDDPRGSGDSESRCFLPALRGRRVERSGIDQVSQSDSNGWTTVGSGPRQCCCQHVLLW